MQTKYSSDKLSVVLLSTDLSKAMYDKRAPKLFEEYGGKNWPSIVLPNGFRSALRFGGIGYGKLIIDAKGMIRSVGELSLENSLKKIFGR